MTGNENSETLVSIVIPTYRRPQYLEGAVKTAVGQTYDDIEVIVVDDGSTEPYADEIVSKFPESVSCIRHEENKGLSAARNTGIGNASGEYIAFLDDDDRWHRSKISRQVSALEQNKNAGLATCLVVAVTPDHKIVHCDTGAPNGDCSRELLLNNKIGSPSRVLVRQECIEEIGAFDESLPTKQDWDFYLRLCQEWNVVAVNEHLCFRTIHDSMSSSSNALERDKNRILEKHEELIRNKKLWKQAKSSIFEEIGRSYIADNELRKSRKYLRQSLSDFTIRRLVLYLLTYTHPIVVHNAIKLKRSIVRRRSECEDISITNTEIPGISEGYE